MQYKNADASARYNLLKKLGYETVWYYQNVQSGDVSYSLVDPMDLHWSEREMYYSKEVRVEDVPLWGLLQLEI